jgi:hypothetical protein
MQVVVAAAFSVHIMDTCHVGMAMQTLGGAYLAAAGSPAVHVCPACGAAVDVTGVTGIQRHQPSAH